MAKVNRKRFRLGSVIDRLHVENAIFSKKNSKLKRDQNEFDEFINPSLLHLNRISNDVISVKPDVSNGKVKNQVYSRSKPSISTRTEGGSSVCELCGNQSFKVFPKAVEIRGDNGKISRFLKQVCRKCYAPEDNFKPIGKSPKRKVRPYYEPPLTGVVGTRASKSWHFVRRDFICRKKLGLHFNQCNENEFREKFLSSTSSGESDDSESESEDEYEDFEDYIVRTDPSLKDRFPKKEKRESHLKSPNNRKSFMNDIRNQKGYQDHLALRNEWCLGSDASTSPNNSTTPSNDEDETPNTSILRPTDIDKIGVLLEEETKTRSVNLELAVNQTEKEGSTLTLPINVELSPSDHADYCHPVSSKDSKQNTDNSSTKVESDVSSTTKTPEDESMEIDTHDYEKIEKELLANIELALEILLIETSDRVSQLLNPLNYIDNEFYDGFDGKSTQIRVRKNEYDLDSMEEGVKDVALPSYDKGVCRLVTVLNMHKGTFKDHSQSSSFYDSKGICRKKQELPVFVELDDDKYHKRKSLDSRKKEIDSLITKYAPVSPLRSPGSDSFIDNDADSNLTLKELQDKFWPNRLSAGATKENICDICRRTMLSSSIYSRDNAPPKILAYFKEFAESIRACKACLVSPADRSNNSPGSAVTIMAGEKRPLLAKDGSVSAKKFVPGGNIRILPKVRRFSRFHETPQFTSRSVTPKVVHRQRTKSSGSNSSNNQQNLLPKIISDGAAVTSSNNTIIGDDIGKYFIKGSSPLNPLGLNSFGRLNLKVVQNPNETDLKSIAQNCKTKYVIVQTAPNSGESKVQKLSSEKNLAAEILGSTTASNGETKLGSHGDITINGQRYKIDSEFKLNDLMKETDNTVLSAEQQKDLLNRLPGFLKRAQSGAVGKGGMPHFKIVNVVEGSPAVIGSSMSPPNSSSARPQAIFVQSLAPGQQQPTTSAVQTKNIPNVKGNVFQTAEFNVNTLKKFQSIAPAPPKGHLSSTPISSSYVVEGGVAKKAQICTAAENATSSAFAVLPRNENGQQLVDRNRVVALNTSIEDIAEGAQKNAKFIEELKQKGVKNFVEIRLPPQVGVTGENTVNRPTRKVILNSAVTADAAKFLTPVANNGVTAVQPNMPEIILTDVDLASPPVESVMNELKSPSKSPSKSPVGVDQLLLTSTDDIMTSSARNSPDSSTAAAAALTVAGINDKETSPSLVKAISASVTTKMSATSTSSLVKSINELGASLNTPQNSSPQSPSSATSSNNRSLSTAVGNCDSSSTVVVALADTNCSSPVPSGYANVSPVDSTTATITDQITSMHSTKGTGSSADENEVQSSYDQETINIDEVELDDASSTVISASTSQQAHQKMKVVPTKSPSSSPIKVSVQNQNGAKVVARNNQQRLELGKGIKINGSLLNTDLKSSTCIDEATKITSTRQTPPKATIVTQSTEP